MSLACSLALGLNTKRISLVPRSPISICAHPILLANEAAAVRVHWRKIHSRTRLLADRESNAMLGLRWAPLENAREVKTLRAALDAARRGPRSSAEAARFISRACRARW